MLRINPVVQFLVLLTLILGVSFFVQDAILAQKTPPDFEDQLILSYSINGFLAGLIYCVLYIFRVKLKNQIGFLFIAGSFLKFIFFFIFLYPNYISDGQISGIEIASFFIPYGISSGIETIYSVKMLQKLDE